MHMLMKQDVLCAVRAWGSKTVWRCKPSDLREHEVLRAAAVQTQDEADRLEELLDARPERLLLHPAGGSWVQDARLDDELEEVLQSLRRLLACWHSISYQFLSSDLINFLFL